MDISKALLEKYELGQCNDQELAAVRAWLDSEEWGDLDFDGSVGTDIRDEMWTDISSILNQPQTVIKESRPRVSPIMRYWKGISAASIILLVGVYYLFYPSTEDLEIFQASNGKSEIVSFSKDHFDLVLSANSVANIDFESGNISLTGNIMFSPKRDFVLQDERSNRSFNFKRGEVYFVSEREEQKKLIILSKKEIMFLPPVIQRKIKQQFHIS